MNVTVSRLCGLVLTLSLVSAGCHGEKSKGSAGVPSAGASAATIISASAVGTASVSPPLRSPMRHYLSLAGVLFRPANDLPSLTDDQRLTMARLAEAPADAGIAEGSAPVVAHRTFQVDLLAGIRAAKLDNAKLQGDYASLDRAVAVAMALDAEALDSLHGVLDASQRQALVDHVRVKRAARPLLPLTASDGGTLDLHRVKLDRWATELGLDDEQKKQVAAVIAKEPMTTATVQARRDAWQRRIDTLLSEFVKDSFEAKALDLSSGSGKAPHEADEAQATFIGALLPLLHADQLKKLSVRMEHGASRPGPGGDDMDMGLPPMAE